jgi:hypothetical protein
MDSEEFNSGFFLTIVGILTAFLSGALVYTIKSKCSKCSLCFGMINIERDVKVVFEEEKFEIEHGLNPFSNQETKI